MKKIQTAFNTLLLPLGLRIIVKERLRRYEAVIYSPPCPICLSTIETDHIVEFVEDLTLEAIDAAKGICKKRDETLSDEKIEAIKAVGNDLLDQFVD